MITKQVKRFSLKILVFLVIGVLVFSPCLLVIDHKKFSPFVFLVWVVSVAYYLWMRRRETFNLLSKKRAEQDDPGDNSNPDEERDSTP
jgi:hypothetical protein